ncbi:MAG: CHASE2 domain-containing protein, partial [Spirochaetales bacterium]
VLFFLLANVVRIPLLSNLELKMLNVHFNFKNVITKTNIQEGVSIETRNPKISPDILIVGIDFRSLNDFGKWPFPRYRHANLIDSFSRIKNQGERENSLFLDVFFIEPDAKAYDDALVIKSMVDNGRVFLETVLDEIPLTSDLEEDYTRRQELLYEGSGEITNVTGPWEFMDSYLGLQPPLQPYAKAAHGFGHANFQKDLDQTYRRQPLVAKSTVLLENFRYEDLSPQTIIYPEEFERLAWFDKNGEQHNIPYPLTVKNLEALGTTLKAKAPLKTEDTDNDGKPDISYYIIRRYKDHFVPSITLALALNYFNKKPGDIKVTLGEDILIPAPQYFDLEKQEWVPYALTLKEPVVDEDGNVVEEGRKQVLPEIRIPIDKNGQMLINFMGHPSFADAGGRQTFPIRSYSGYAARVPSPDPNTWPRTKAVGNKMIMVGAFARGIATDEKTTPYGLMYGVEIHANALNTIVMNNFLKNVPIWVDGIILLVLVLFTTFTASRLSTILSLIVTIVLIIAFFIGVSLVFDEMAYVVNFSTNGIAMFLTFLSIVVYRIMTEEKDKARIRETFGKYVSPKVVEQILENPPELGGVDKDLTVFFSDIRGFTTLSETMTHQELVNHLNLYLTAMTDIILEYQGTLDKYVGDEIMCFWGAPVPQDDHALIACKSALKQIEVLNELNSNWPPERRINIGIGLNSGIMTVGNMGSMGRMNYTLMGDNVNLGARLEGTNKEYHTTIIISENTYSQVKDKVIVRELDNIRVKGKNRSVLIYELLDCVDGLEPPLKTDNGKKRR